MPSCFVIVNSFFLSSCSSSSLAVSGCASNLIGGGSLSSSPAIYSITCAVPFVVAALHSKQGSPLSSMYFLNFAICSSLARSHLFRPLGNLFREILKLVVYLLKVIFGISALNARNVYNVNYKSASFNVS